MRKTKYLFVFLTGLLVVFFLCFLLGTDVKAAAREEYVFPSAGVAEFLGSDDVAYLYSNESEKPQNINEKFASEKERMERELVMANVQRALNVRAEADEKAEKIGYLYKDCGGQILERADGWTKLQSGNVIGWAKDEYLLFGEDAKSLAEDVGNWIITLESAAVRVRKEPEADAEVYGLLAYEDTVEFISMVDQNWISVDYNGEVGYVNSEFVNVRFHIDEGETMEVIKVREREEEERKRKANQGRVDADADELRLLGALIYCEAGNQPYEGMVAVGAVVMNRVRSGAYPNTIHSVIYASGQFTPAMTGKVASVYNANKIPEACLRAAQAAIDGETTVGSATHFKRVGRHEGYEIAGHVFW